MFNSQLTPRQIKDKFSWQASLEEDLGKGFLMKGQDDVIVKDGNFTQWRTQRATPEPNRNNNNSQEVKQSNIDRINEFERQVLVRVKEINNKIDKEKVILDTDESALSDNNKLNN
ncbi:hypothetical protein C1646_758883 [Rhizophagus diaphanus]|nr:hypothetical protein C1646_758883 [Rhizophagus diaphanus] [Rhizophagus sp. MUCL 43196]